MFCQHLPSGRSVSFKYRLRQYWRQSSDVGLWTHVWKSDVQVRQIPHAGSSHLYRVYRLEVPQQAGMQCSPSYYAIFCQQSSFPRIIPGLNIASLLHAQQQGGLFFLCAYRNPRIFLSHLIPLKRHSSPLILQGRYLTLQCLHRHLHLA
ncbi:hypothetical protein R1sor_004977 [Riccia sorocarpa]|uniref:Uncharacterized protein n=1 Tax=Riccia sorocarpa TaxID=122646 RepID=A0ABD3HKF0_9MARC